MKKRLSSTMRRLQSACHVLLLSLVFSAPCVADWQLDLRIDRELGLFDQSWHVPLTRLRTRFDLPATVQSGFPPYSQQVEGAQQFPMINQQPNGQQQP
jgi:hypothetical protein